MMFTSQHWGTFKLKRVCPMLCDVLSVKVCKRRHIALCIVRINKGTDKPGVMYVLKYNRKRSETQGNIFKRGINLNNLHEKQNLVGGFDPFFGGGFDPWRI